MGNFLQSKEARPRISGDPDPNSVFKCKWKKNDQVCLEKNKDESSFCQWHQPGEEEPTPSTPLTFSKVKDGVL